MHAQLFALESIDKLDKWCITPAFAPGGSHALYSLSRGVWVQQWCYSGLDRPFSFSVRAAQRKSPWALLLKATELCFCVRANKPVCLHSLLQIFHPDSLFWLQTCLGMSLWCHVALHGHLVICLQYNGNLLGTSYPWQPGLPVCFPSSSVGDKLLQSQCFLLGSTVGLKMMLVRCGCSKCTQSSDDATAKHQPCGSGNTSARGADSDSCSFSGHWFWLPCVSLFLSLLHHGI